MPAPNCSRRDNMSLSPPTFHYRRDTLAGGDRGRRVRGAVRVEPARVGGPPVAVRDHQWPSAPEVRRLLRQAVDQGDRVTARPVQGRGSPSPAGDCISTS